MIDLTEYLITHRNFQFVLTSRFTQDCVENLFSQIRQKNVVPNPLQFTYNIKLISIAMYMKPINNSNYDNDDQEYLSGFLQYLKPDKKEKIDFNNDVPQNNIPNIPPFIFNKSCTKKLTTLESHSLYNHYIILRVIQGDSK